MKRRCLAVCLIALFVVASGCIAEDFPSKENEHLGGSDAGDASDISDAGDATDPTDATDATDTSDGGGDATDSGNDSGDAGDGGDLPQNCSTPSDCDTPGERQGVDCINDACVYECETSFGDCDKDISNGCEVELNQPERCGSCDNRCTPGDLNYAPTCEDPAQQTCGTDPTACAPGFYDISADVEGCEYECEFQSDEDIPDADGIDQNCDGIDGTVADAVFVSEDGDASNNGLEPNLAVPTISQALSIADTEGRSYLLVSAGAFQEVVNLKSGVSIYGGYDKSTWEHDADQIETLIEPPAAGQHDNTMHFRTVIADGLTDPTVLDGLTIAGFNAQSNGPAGSSTYVMWARNSTDLSLSNSVLRAGDAARGANGGPGANGDTLTCNADGGDGGSTNTGDVACNGTGEDGSVGSAGTSPANGGQRGLGGSHDCAGLSGGCDAGDGGNGSPGDPGSNGVHGSTGSAEGSVDAELWAPSNGTPGADGHNGTGGGGGGAGGDCGNSLGSTATSAHYRGGFGGHGGEGGCGGEGGQNGKQGGGSFGLLSVGSVVSLSNVSIERATGGAGGDGGDGGFQGETSNSSRSLGYQPNANSAKGGDGGLGGDGGSGGGGAGGCGGPSVGIAYTGTQPTESNVSFPAAPDSAVGGTGGDHGDPNDSSTAPSGCSGTVTSTLDLSSN